MELVAGAGGGYVEDAAGFLRFAVAIDAIDPLLGGAAVGALGLKGGDEKLGDFGGAVGLRCQSLGGKAALEPGEHAVICLCRSRPAVRGR